MSNDRHEHTGNCMSAGLDKQSGEGEVEAGGQYDRPAVAQQPALHLLGSLAHWPPGPARHAGTA